MKKNQNFISSFSFSYKE